MILLDDGPFGRAAAFVRPKDIILAQTLAEVAPALARLDRARAQGCFVAGYMAYEAGFAFEARLAALHSGAALGWGMAPQPPLLAFGLYDAPQDAGDLHRQAQDAAPAVDIGEGATPAISLAEYCRAFDQVQAYIAAGDCYQINLTFPMRARLQRGTPLGLFAALAQRQKVGHGGFVDLGVGPVLVSRSPELFLRTTATGRIETRPMKGTAPRDADPAEDAALADALRHSAKGQAENLMIVDLLRNDMARICAVGSVKVPVLFGIETYATLHQMVSRVAGQLLAPPSLASVMPALFPCGSITGAPKIRAMQIIHQVEAQTRGAYCGAIGWMGPDGASSFSVSIRTLQVMGQDIVLNVGGGVVQDSTAQGEWQEALWKARYFTALARTGSG